MTVSFTPGCSLTKSRIRCERACSRRSNTISPQPFSGAGQGAHFVFLCGAWGVYPDQHRCPSRRGRLCWLLPKRASPEKAFDYHYKLNPWMLLPPKGSTFSSQKALSNKKPDCRSFYSSTRVNSSCRPRPPLRHDPWHSVYRRCHLPPVSPWFRSRKAAPRSPCW